MLDRKILAIAIRLTARALGATIKEIPIAIVKFVLAGIVGGCYYILIVFGLYAMGVDTKIAMLSGLGIVGLTLPLVIRVHYTYECIMQGDWWKIDLNWREARWLERYLNSRARESRDI